MFRCRLVPPLRAYSWVPVSTESVHTRCHNQLKYAHFCPELSSCRRLTIYSKASGSLPLASSGGSASSTLRERVGPIPKCNHGQCSCSLRLSCRYIQPQHPQYMLSKPKANSPTISASHASMRRPDMSRVETHFRAGSMAGSPSNTKSRVRGPDLPETELGLTEGTPEQARLRTSSRRTSP